MGFDKNEINLVKFQDGKWNFPNRKLNYFSHFQAPDQRTPFSNVSHLVQGFQNKFSKQEIELF